MRKSATPHMTTSTPKRQQMDWKQKEAERESEKIKNNNLEKQVKILELQTENFALKKQIDTIGGTTSPTASPDGANEYKEMLS